MFFTKGTIYLNEDVEYFCRVMFEVLKTPIYFLDNNGDIYTSFSYGHAENPMNLDKSELFQKLFGNTTKLDFPIIKSTEYLENYAAVHLKMEDIYIGTFIIGPSTYSIVTAETIDSLISERKIPLIHKRELVKYFNSLSVIDYKKLLNIGMLLYYSIYNKKLYLTDVAESNSTLKDVDIKIKHEYDSSFSNNRQNSFFHHSRTHEMKIYGSIREGNGDKLLQYMQIPLDGEPGILSRNNPIRSQKNHAICSVTLATRAAIEGGLDTETAYTLSDLYIQDIEEIYEVKDLAALVNKMLLDFTDKVHKIKGCNYSKPILACQSYIFKHLYEHISLSELADFVDLNPNYLSELFKKDVGITLSEYIQKEKIEEAKRLLLSSNYSLLEISSLLNFHDQSHFTRLFKKYTGITPKKFRS